MAKVVTYNYAYKKGRVNLCRDCLAGWSGPSLADVYMGQHEAECHGGHCCTCYGRGECSHCILAKLDAP